MSNNPIKLVDPSGHAHCNPDNDTCYLNTGEPAPNLSKELSSYKTVYTSDSHSINPRSSTGNAGQAQRDPKEFSTSDRGVEFIAQWESFSSLLYNDPAGNCTIGYGHLVHMLICDGNPTEAIFANGITQKEGYSLLSVDIASAETAIKQLVSVSLTQNQFDVLVDFVYNIGGGNFQTSTLLEKLNARDYASVPDELIQWVYGSNQEILPGLVNRRNQEIDIWVNGY